MKRQKILTLGIKNNSKNYYEDNFTNSILCIIFATIILRYLINR